MEPIKHLIELDIQPRAQKEDWESNRRVYGVSENKTEITPLKGLIAQEHYLPLDILQSFDAKTITLTGKKILLSHHTAQGRIDAWLKILIQQ